MRVFCLLLLLSLTTSFTQGSSIQQLHQLLKLNASPDSDACLYCVAGLTILEDNIADNVEFWANFLKRVCESLPPIEQVACEATIERLGVPVILKLLEKYNPNYVCGPDVLGVCVECSVEYVQPVEKFENKFEQSKNIFLHHLVASWIRQKTLDIDEENVLPAVDEDGDNFSPVNDRHRTAKWRGRDCNDTLSSVHPGALDPSDGSEDNNCNGIFGQNPISKISYEKEFCETDDSLTSRRSTVIFGDSAAAAFRIPVEWLDFENLATIPETAIQELDFPHMSWCTGYDKIGNDSIYLYMREQNLCNHLDFQNLAKNGAEMEDLPGYQVTSLTPSKYPLLAVVAYIGNDVCKKSLEDMTDPDAYYNYAIEGLNQLNAVAAPGSKVLLIGLVDGRVLWDTLYNKVHPLGMTYENFYNFLTCTGANPCWTWLNSDEAVRNATSFRAAELSSKLVEIVKNDTLTATWPNLEVQYVPFPVEQIIEWLEFNGEDPAVLIEPVDGFHPSQEAHRVIAKVVWKYVSVKFPDFFGTPNPENGKIAQKFPDQGPY